MTQTERDRRYRENMTPEQKAKFNERRRYNSAKSFINKHATNEQLNELKQLIDDKLKPWSTIGTKREQSRH